MFMSYVVTGHIQFRIGQSSSGCAMALRHRAAGMIETEHRERVVHGWQSMLSDIKSAGED